MVTTGYDPFDYQVQADPYPVYAWLRDHAPVYRNEQIDFWALSRHADVAAAWPDSQRFSSANGVQLEPSSWGPDAWKWNSFVAMDPPRHTRFRGLVAGVFTARRVAQLEPFIRALAQQYTQAAIEAGTFDFISSIAGPLPADVISELVGAPEIDRAELRKLTDTVIHHGDGEHDLSPAAVQAALTLAGYFRELTRQRHRKPGDDLVSDLTQARDEHGQLTEREITAVLFLLMTAGTETTTRLLGNAWYHAWRHPDQQAKAWAGNITGWINETLRYDSPAQLVARTLTRDLTQHGIRMPAGARILLLAGSANRDSLIFADPDRYDIERDTSAAMPFGKGRHFCLGAPLARLEARLTLEELTHRVTTYDIGEAGATRVRSPTVRGFTCLPTTITGQP